jgi:uncharacterized protein (TIGR00251 family)
MLRLRAVDDGIEFLVRAQPKASRTAIVGLHGERLKVTVTAAPADGKANRAIIERLADAFDVRRADVEIVAGHASRDKTVRIRGLASKEARRRLARILANAQSRASKG